MSEKLLVTGASGHLGRLVIARLVETLGISPSDIVAATRDPDTLTGKLPAGIAIRAVDFNDPSKLAAAFAGIDRLLLISTNDLSAPGRRLAQQRAAVAAAKAADVKGIVYTSAPNPHGDNHPLFFAGDHAGTEDAIVESGLAFRILRNSWYQENFLMSLPNDLKSGKLLTSAGDGAVAYVGREDCAAVAAAALARPWTDDRQVLDVTGPEALTIDDVAALARAAFGKPLDVVHMAPEALASTLRAHGVPEGAITFVLSFDATNRAGLVSGVSDTVEAWTGSKPRTLAAYFASAKSQYAG